MEKAPQESERQNSESFNENTVDVNHKENGKLAIDIAWNEKRYDKVLKLLQRDSNFPGNFTLRGLNEDDEIQRQIKLFAEERYHLHELIRKKDLNGVKKFIANNQSKYYLNTSNESAAFTAIKSKHFHAYAYLKTKGVGFNEVTNEDPLDGLDFFEKNALREVMLGYFPQHEQARIFYIFSKLKFQPENQIALYEEKMIDFLDRLDGISEISTILKVIQYASNLEIVLDFDNNDVIDVCILLKSAVGLTLYDEGTIYIAAGPERGDDPLLGTIAHELTHLAMKMIFQNNGNPYHKSKDTLKEQEFKMLTKKIEDMHTTLLNQPVNQTTLVGQPLQILLRAFTCYDPPIYHSELIVRVSQILAQYIDGRQWLEKNVPDLFKYYKDYVIKKCQEFLENAYLLKPRSFVQSMNEYPGEMINVKKHHVFFKDVRKISKFLSEEKKKIFIFSSTNTWMGLLRILQGLFGTDYLTTYDHFLVLKLDETCIKEFANVKKVFESEATNTLIIECPLELPKKTSSDNIRQLINVVTTNDKKIIFVLNKEEENRYNQLIENRGLIGISTKKRDEEYTLYDLEESSRSHILGKEITFQSSKTNLHEVIGNDQYLQELIDVETIGKLIHDQKIALGGNLLRTSSLEGAFADIAQEVNMDTLADELVNSKDCFVISNIGGTNKKNELEKYLKRDLDASFIFEGDNYYARDIGDKKIFLPDDDDKFKDFCHNNPEKKIHLLDVKHDEDGTKFFLKQTYDPDFYIKRKFKNSFVIDNAKLNQTSKDSSETFIISYDNLINKHVINNHPKILWLDPENAKIEFERLTSSGQTVHKLQLEDDFLVWKESYGSIKKLREYIGKDSRINHFIEEKDLIKEIANKKAIIIADNPGMGKSTSITKLYGTKYDEETKSLACSHWIIRINLKDAFRDSKIKYLTEREITVDDVVYFLSKVDCTLEDTINKNLLRGALEKGNLSRPLLIVFDGFDELLNDEDRTTIISLLKYLKDDTMCKFWITTRLHYKEFLEDELTTFAVAFEPLNDESKKEFVTRYFKNRFNLILSRNEFESIFETQKMELYMRQFLEKIKTIFKDDLTLFIGTPLQLTLLLEISVNHFLEWAKNSDDKINLDYLGSDILEVYDNFIKRKSVIHFQKTDLPVESRQKKEMKLLNDYHKDLAETLIRNTKSEKDWKEDRALILAFGIIVMQSERFEFVHFTFREYFAALVFVDYIKNKDPQKQFQLLNYLVYEILLKEDYQLIRKFLNKHLERINKKNLDINIVPESNLNHLGEMMASFFNQKREKSVLQIATEEDNEYLLEFLIFCTEYRYGQTQNLRSAILKHGLDFNLLLSAAIKGSNKVFVILTDFMMKLPRKEQYEIICNGVQEDDDAPLHRAAEFGHTEIVTSILKKAAEIVSEDEQFKVICKRNYRGKTALSLAIEHDQLEVIHQILKEAKNMSKEKQSAMFLMTIPDRHCRTNIQFLAVEKNFKTFRFILENACEILPSKELRDFLRLNETQFLKKSEEFSRLNAKSCSEAQRRTETFKSDFEKELQVLERYWETEDYKYRCHGSWNEFFDRLSEMRERETSERFALWNKALEKENKDMMELILEKVAKLAIPQELFEMLCYTFPCVSTALHFASAKGQYKLINLLLEKMKEISTREQQFELFCLKTDVGDTILHLALINGHYEIVELILQKLGELLSEETKNLKSSKDVLQKTSLLVGVAQGEKESVLLVLKKAEKILSPEQLFEFLTVKENIEETALHLAVIRKDVEIITILLKKADELLPSEKWFEFVAMENGKCESAFHIASALYCDKIIKLFLDIAEEKPERVFKLSRLKDKGGKSALHIASEKGHIETVKHLLKSVEKFSPEQVFELFSMTTGKHYLKTAFLLAAEKGHDEILMSLLNTVQKMIPEKTFTLLCIKDRYHDTAFAKCVEYCQKETIASILKMASSKTELELLKIPFRDDETILHKATKNRRDEIVKMLFGTVKTLPPEVIFELLCMKNHYQETVFHTASRHCSDETVKLLLQHTESLSPEQTFHLITQKDICHNTILSQAAENCQREAVKLLLKNATKLSPDQKFNFLSMKYTSTFDETIFTIACKKNCHKIFKLLVEILKTLPLKEAFDLLFIKWVGLKSMTPLQYACCREQDEAALLLLEFAENLSLEKAFEWSCMKDEDFKTALHIACQYKRDKVVKALLESAGKLSSEKPFELLSIPDKDHKTALHIAAHVGHTKIVKLLLEYADKMPEEKFLTFLSREDKNRETALHIAATLGHDEILKTLLQFTEKISPENAFKLLCISNRYQETVLHQASKNCHTETVKFLLELAEKLSLEKASSLLHMQDDQLKTALHKGIIGYRESNVKLIVEKAVKISPKEAEKLLLTTDKYKSTALHQAASKGLLNTVKLILETSFRLNIYESITNEKDKENKTARDLAYSFGVKHLLTKKE